MPSRRTHETLTVIAVATNIPAVMVGYTFGTLPGVYFFMGTLVTLIRDFTPDLDVSARKFGWFGEFVGFRLYADLVGHRAGLHSKDWQRLKVWNVFMLSHIPGLGTLPRTVMLYTPFLIIFLILELPLEYLIYSFPFVWGGMSYGDIWHVIPDIITTDFKEMRKGFWRKRRVHGERTYYNRSGGLHRKYRSKKGKVFPKIWK